MSLISGTMYDMNYLFIKKVEGKMNNGYTDGMLRNFLESISIALENNNDNESMKLLKKEALEEFILGTYYEEYSISQFKELLNKAISELCGEEDNNVFDFYMELFQKSKLLDQSA